MNSPESINNKLQDWGDKLYKKKVQLPLYMEKKFNYKLRLHRFLLKKIGIKSVHLTRRKTNNIL